MKGLLKLVRIASAIAVLLIVTGSALLAQSAPCNERDMSRIGEQNTYVDTVDKKVTQDSVTNQKITSYRLKVSYKPGPTSAMRICISKEPSEVKEFLRPPVPLPPVTTEAPTPPPPTNTFTNPPQPAAPPHQHSCWRSVSWCTVPTALALIGGGWAGYKCATDWCAGSVMQDVRQHTSVGDRRRGIMFSVPVP